MTQEDSISKPKTRARKALRIVGWTALGLFALYFIVGVFWRYSGSENWELAADTRGAKVYTLKPPGSDRVQFKITFRIRGRMSSVFTYFQDPDICNLRLIGGCEVEYIGPQFDGLKYVRMKGLFTFPLKTRDFILRIMVHQNPNTKQALMSVDTVPNISPPDPCCVRVWNMNNQWTLTPAGDGLFDVEYILNADPGAYYPYHIALKRMIVRNGPLIAGQMAKLANSDRYKNATLPNIVEP